MSQASQLISSCRLSVRHTTMRTVLHQIFLLSSPPFLGLLMSYCTLVESICMYSSMHNLRVFQPCVAGIGSRCRMQRRFSPGRGPCRALIPLISRVSRCSCQLLPSPRRHVDLHSVRHLTFRANIRHLSAKAKSAPYEEALLAPIATALLTFSSAWLSLSHYKRAYRKHCSAQDSSQAIR